MLAELFNALLGRREGLEWVGGRRVYNRGVLLGGSEGAEQVGGWTDPSLRSNKNSYMQSSHFIGLASPERDKHIPKLETTLASEIENGPFRPFLRLFVPRMTPKDAT